MSHKPRDQGPTLDQEPMVIHEADPGDETQKKGPPESEPKPKEAKYSMTFTDDELVLLSSLTGSALCASFPQLWGDNVDFAIQISIIQAGYAHAEATVNVLGEDGARALKEKFKVVHLEMMKDKGIDIEEAKAKTLNFVQEVYKALTSEVAVEEDSGAEKPPVEC